MSRHSIGTATTWQIAMKEAAQAGHPLVEPEHLVIGLCSLDRARQPGALGKPLGAQEAAWLGMEADSLSAVLMDCALDPASIRRSLRERLGRRPGQGHGERISRSAASRASFERAEEIARAWDHESGEVGVLHLLAAILDAPGDHLRAVLQRLGAAPEQVRLRIDGELAATRLVSMPRAEMGESGSTFGPKSTPHSGAQTPVRGAGPRPPVAERGALGELAGSREELEESVVTGGAGGAGGDWPVFGADRPLEQMLRTTMVGQDEATARVAGHVRRAQAGLADPDRPRGVLLLVGPAGAGKATLALAVADALLGSAERLLRWDLADEDADVGIAEALRRQPASVVLLERADQASPRVARLVGRVFEAGRRALFLLTATSPTVPEPLADAVDEVVTLAPLGPAEIGELARRRLDALHARLLRDRKIVLDATDAVIGLLARQTCERDPRPRELDRVIGRLILEPLSDLLLAGQVVEYGHVVARAEDGEITVGVDLGTV